MAETDGAWFRGLGLALILGLTLFVVAAFVVDRAERSRSELPVLVELPGLPAAVGWTEADDSVRAEERLVIVGVRRREDGDAVSIMADRLEELQRAFEGADQVQLVAMTLLGSNDIEIVQDLPSDPQTTMAVWESLQEYLDGTRGGRIGPRLVLIDGAGRVRGQYDATDDASLKTLKDHVRQLVRP